MKKLIMPFLLLSALWSESIWVYNNLILGYPVKEIKAKFQEKYPDIKVKLLNAPLKIVIKKMKTLRRADVVITSSDKFLEKYPECFTDERKIIGESFPVIEFLKGRKYTLEDFLKKRAVLGYKDTTSIGKVADEIFTKYKGKSFSGRIFSRAMKVKSSKQLSDAILYKKADVGINWKGSLFWPKYKNKLGYASIDPKYYKKRNVTAVITPCSKNKEAARKFLDFISSPEGLKIMKKWGF
ncbi:substrate-binding domain-containing protein [Nautilia sp.]